MSTSPLAATSWKSTCRAREPEMLASSSASTARAGTLGRRPGGRSDHEEDAVVPGELDLGVHLRAVERPLGDEVAAVAPEREDIRGEADAELGGERRRVAHPVDGEPDEDDVGAAVGDELLDRLADRRRSRTLPARP